MLGTERFDSKKEMNVYLLLVGEELRGTISGLKRQVTYALKVKGKLVCRYVADFVYYHRGLRQKIVADAKGLKLRTFVMKAKLFEAITRGKVKIKTDF